MNLLGPTSIPPHLPELPQDLLKEVLRRLPEDDMYRARLACKSLAEAGKEPSLPAWQVLLHRALEKAATPEKCTDIIAKAADRHVLGRATHLHLSSKNLSLGHIKQILCAFGHLELSGLKYLDLSCNELGTAGAQALADSTSLTALQQLDMSRNRLGDAGAEALANSANLTTLQQLGLRFNNLGAAGTEALANSANLTALRQLDM